MTSDRPRLDAPLLFAPAALIGDRLVPATIALEDGRIRDVRTGAREDGATALPDDTILSPGFVDLQVNGGGGALFNDAPCPETLARMVDAHRAGGTTTLLPTLITDRPGTIARACAAVRTARALGLPGIGGIHLEGPFLSPDRPGVHRRDWIRPMSEQDAAALEAEARAGGLGAILLTLAPETLAPGLLARLAAAGIVLAAGHSEASAAETRAAIGGGLRGFTHLWNAMPPVASRAPGIVAAALADRDSWCGLIADLIHVDADTLALTLAAKPRDRLFVVTDSMPPAGTDLAGFELQGRWIARANGRLETEDGTLAGADLDMIGAVRTLHRALGVPLAHALRMASTIPAAFARLADRGRIAPGLRADLVLLDRDLAVRETAIAVPG